MSFILSAPIRKDTPLEPAARDRLGLFQAISRAIVYLHTIGAKDCHPASRRRRESGSLSMIVSVTEFADFGVL
jgi:hypothetical protein